MRKILLIFLILCILMFLSPRQTFGSEKVSIQFENNTNLSIYKSFEFSIPIPKSGENSNFILKDAEGKELPLELIKKEDTIFTFRTLLSLDPNENKTLVLEFGSDLEQSNKHIFMPNFYGTKFVGIGSGKLVIISLSKENLVKVIGKNKNIFEGKLSEKEFKIIPLEENEVFSIESNAPLFAFVSSLSENPDINSSDDFSSVFGKHFLLYIPKEIFISALKSTKVKVSDLNGGVIYDGVLKDREIYFKTSLKEGIYEIESEEPVNVTFGYVDDNIYGIMYGDTESFKGVSFGSTLISSIFPNTSINIKTPSESKQFVLAKKGDLLEYKAINNFKENNTEFIPIYITYSDPVIIYSDSNFGNLGGEQIPSLDGSSKLFCFRTGKVYNFGDIKRNIGITVVASQNDTEVNINGKIYKMNTLDSVTEKFSESHALVEISSKKPVSVFEIGLDTSMEFFSTLLPIYDNSISFLGAIAGKNETENGQQGGSNSVKRFMDSVLGYFKEFWSNIEAFFKSENISNIIKNIEAFLKDASNRIIILLYPISEYLYPYISKVFPQVTKENISAFIFIAFILIILLLIFIPKRRKKKENIPVVDIEDIKKRQVTFNIKTIEESVPSPTEVEEPHPTIIKIKKEEIKQTLEESLEKTGTEGLVEEERKPFKVASPIWKRPVKPSQTKELQKEEKPIEVKPIEVKPIHVTEEIVENIEVTKAQVAPTSEAQYKEEEKEQSFIDFVKPAILEEEEEVQSFDAFAQPKDFYKETLQERKDELLKEHEETEIKIPEKEEEPLINESELEGSQKQAEEKKESSEFLKELEKSLEEVLKPLGEKTEEKASPEEKQTILKGEEQKEVEEQEEETSTFDKLLQKIQKHEIIEEPAVKEEPISKPKEGVSKTSGKEILRKKLELGAVFDADSINKLFEILNEDEKRSIFTGKAFISANERTKIKENFEISKYKLGIIALTEIEERLVSDISKRIGGNIASAEAILIARKIRINEVVVNDSPKIRNYQGININNLNEII